MPPKIKVLEATGAIADGRIKQINEREFTVISSEGDRTYSVYVDLKKKEACSTDNGTKFRGYIGYPIISILMIKKALPYNENIARALSHIDWKALNEKYKKYSLVEEEVKRIALSKGVSETTIEAFKERVYKELKKIRLKSTTKCYKNIAKS